MDGQSKSDAQLEWLINLREMPVPVPKQPFVRTYFINSKNDGCYICGRKSTVTKHHIKRGRKPVAVYLCWKHHQIAHATGLDRFTTADIRTVLAVADRYKLWKKGEKNLVRKKLMIEIDMRKNEIN